jgi:hypothetical protein
MHNEFKEMLQDAFRTDLLKEHLPRGKHAEVNKLHDTIQDICKENLEEIKRVKNGI